MQASWGKMNSTHDNGQSIMRNRTIYTLDQTDIQRHVGNSIIFQRGYGYYRAGRVSHLEVRDDHIRARVVGSQENTYKVEAWCEEGELWSTCTCPYTWGVCKHVAATLCAWINRRADPQIYTRTTMAEWRARLEAIPPTVLIDQIIDEVGVDMLLERYVKRWLEKLSPSKLPNLIAELFRHARAGSPTELEHTLARVSHLLHWAESLPPEQAIAVASETLKRIEANSHLTSLAGADEAVRRSLNILRTRVPQAHLDAPAGHSLLRLLVKLLQVPVPAWRAPSLETLLTLADHLQEREFLIGEVRKKAYGDDPSLMRLLAHLYKCEGRMEEYAAARAKSLLDESDYLELFQFYIDDNRPEEAMRVGEQGMKHLGPAAPQLAERLTALYLEWGERELARQHLRRCFDYWPSEKLLKQLESLSQERKEWKTEQAQLHKRLKAKAGSS